ncbi:hypothetical protein [Paenibacillus popilliae]|uniref:Predicted metal-dependent membrane protease n=1 Tax=Paenibacillus popilliae ATCC 14706 TaxID=1212764 RepID=M9M478_PAEPP|nr:hypothetical protein [Paenibacillus popilliae]GAC42083.1 predicted metal-dependent membrane protease [Paenibacillus popilliae ATCC 14706]
MKNMSKKARIKLQEMSTKAYLLLKNQRGDANSTSQLMWIVIVVAAVVLAWGLMDGWIKTIFAKLQDKANEILNIK